jgi:hypothetical protein
MAAFNPGNEVEYQTGLGEYHAGIVVSYDEDAEQLTVRDCYDDSLWTGPADKASLLSD